MGITTIIALLEEFGPPAIGLITKLIALVEAKGTVSATEWATLTSDLTQTASDRMLARLKAAGIDPSSTQGQALMEMAQ